MQKDSFSVFGLSDEQAVEIVANIVCWAAWFGDKPGTGSESEVCNKIFQTYQDRESQFAMFVLGKLGAAHKILGTGLIQGAFDAIRDLDIEKFEHLHKIMMDIVRNSFLQDKFDREKKSSSNSN